MGKLILKCGNILDYLHNIDAIVNSTNKHMICGSGICRVIYNKANKNKLEEYCRNNFKEKMKFKEVRITKGFDLGIDIIHIYCPRCYESEKSLNDLLESYENIFIIAKKKNYKNILSVSIGSGINGYKHNDIAKNIVDKLNELVNKYNIDFHLILPNEEILDIYYS